MVNEGYHTHANLRELCGMPAAPGPPTDANLTIWVNMVDAIIEAYSSSPTAEIAQGIEVNRIQIIYNSTKPTLNREPWKKGDPLMVEPLTTKEGNQLDGYETVFWK